jgi:hypothetical protein
MEAQVFSKLINEDDHLYWVSSSINSIYKNDEYIRLYKSFDQKYSRYQTFGIFITKFYYR